MKKTVAAVLVMGAMVSVNQVSASGNTKAPSVKPASNMQVSFDNLSDDSKLYIKDLQGQILYTEKIESQGQYSRAFDFTALPPSEYYFEVDKKGFISVLPFTVADDLVELHEERSEEIIKPMLVLDNQQVKLMRNLDQEQSIKVEIYYEGRNLVYSETIDRDGMIGKIFDFSGSASGDYLFSIDFEDRNYSEYLSINTIY